MKTVTEAWRSQFKFTKLGFALLVVLLLFGIASVSADSVSAAGRCDAPGSRTSWHKGDVRVYRRWLKHGGEKTRTYFACSTRYGRHWRFPYGEFPGEEQFHHFATAGRYLAYASDSICAACEENYQFLERLNLRTGGRLFTVDQVKFTTDDHLEPCGDIYGPSSSDCEVHYLRIVVTTSGSFAASIYASNPYDLSSLSAVVRYQGVGRKTHVTVLDRDADSYSLKRRGRTLTWTKGGVAKSATIR